MWIFFHSTNGVLQFATQSGTSWSQPQAFRHLTSRVSSVPRLCTN